MKSGVDTGEGKRRKGGGVNYRRLIHSGGRKQVQTERSKKKGEKKQFPNQG